MFTKRIIDVYKRQVKKQTEGYKKKFHVALFFTIVLSAAIVTMFGITYVLSLIHI